MPSSNCPKLLGVQMCFTQPVNQQCLIRIKGNISSTLSLSLSLFLSLSLSPPHLFQNSCRWYRLSCLLVKLKQDFLAEFYKLALTWYLFSSITTFSAGSIPVKNAICCPKPIAVVLGKNYQQNFVWIYDSRSCISTLYKCCIQTHHVPLIFQSWLKIVSATDDNLVGNEWYS
jgi:hypothetical protein